MRLLLVAALAVAGLAPAAPAAAQVTIEVTVPTDRTPPGVPGCGQDGCTLREAVVLANSQPAVAYTISIPAGGFEG